jgi:putative membrane protein insertion efficiency factor
MGSGSAPRPMRSDPFSTGLACRFGARMEKYRKGIPEMDSPGHRDTRLPRRHASARSFAFGPFAVLLFLFLCFLCSAEAAAQDDPMKGPWTAPEAFQDTPGRSTNPAVQLIRLYQEFLSPIAGDRCPMYPSCSEYGVECFTKHGGIKGWVMTWDRLLRCGRDDLRSAPQIVTKGGEYKYYDPVAGNDFWRVGGNRNGENDVPGNGRK